MLVAGKVFTASLSGRLIEDVTCEKCGTGFPYELTREGIGKGSSVYMLFQGSASRRAEEAARSNLIKRLGEEAELVPCPKCHWVNESLIKKYRRQQYRRAPRLIAILFVGGFVLVPIIGAFLTDAFGYNSRVPFGIMLPLMAITLLSPIWVLLIRRQLRLRIDPNATYPRWPPLPAGTPPALVEQVDATTGEKVLVPSARPVEVRVGQMEWATYRPGQISFPSVCCVCLGAATTTYQSPMKVNARADIEVPLCGSCRAGIKRRWWGIMFMAAPVAFALSGILAITIPGGDVGGRWALFGILGFFGSLVGGVVAGSILCRPYRIKVVDADRGIAKFAAKNPRFTALLIEQVRESDGTAGR